MTTPESNPLLDVFLTQICELGCTRVTEIIVILEQGKSTPETMYLPDAERAWVLDELKAIMAVYNGKKGGPC